MVPKRAIGPLVAAGAIVAILLALILAPAGVGRFVKGFYHSLPDPVQEAVPDDVEEDLGESVDGSVRFFSFGNPSVLVESPLRLTRSEPIAYSWSPSRTIELQWTPLGTDQIQYEVRLGPLEGAFEEATVALTTSDPQASVALPSDGQFLVYVQPRTESKRGQVSQFGPFLVDSTPPDPPRISPRDDPPGYRFQINWSAVSDTSGLLRYEVSRSLNGGTYEPLAHTADARLVEDQLGNGQYAYRVRAVNGAGLASEWSPSLNITVRSLMSNPGEGTLTFGIHANYTGFLYLWDLTDYSKYSTLDQIPESLREKYLVGDASKGIETDNQTLRSLVASVVGSERNAMKISESLFVFLFNETDYDTAKLSGPDQDLQRAGETLDRGKGICGDLATLYLTLLRIAGVPARPIHGYLDNAIAGVGGFHMWIEVYVGPGNADRPWMTVDVSGVTGDPDGDHKFTQEYLFAYFGIFNPDYLALGEEVDYADEAWNTWAQFQWANPKNAPGPEISDQTTLTEYEQETGCLYFNVHTRATKYVKADSGGQCPRTQPGYTGYYAGIKGLSKKRIDYGANVERLPSCVSIALRYPLANEYGAVHYQQSVIYEIYERSSSAKAKISAPQSNGWVVFTDGTSDSCSL